MKKFITEYNQGTRKFGSHVWAASEKIATDIITKRNIGEKIIGVGVLLTDGYMRKINIEEANPTFKDLTDFDFVKKLPHIIHSACFLCFITNKDNSVLSDTGIIHELIHLLTSEHTTTRDIRIVRKQFLKLQREAIGFYHLSQF